MADLLSIGASGVRAYSQALSTVSDNIANSQTAGYVRRTTQLSEAVGGGDVIFYRNTVHPGGSVVTGVSRGVDEWLVQDSRNAGADAGRASALSQWLQVGENALDDGDNGVGASVTAVFNAADRLGASPGDTTLRAAFLQAVDTSAAAFRQTANQLASASNGVATAAQGAVTQVNDDLAALQKVNQSLLRARDGSTNQAALLDERDRLVDSISSHLGVSASFGDRGEVTLNVSGTGGATLLSGSTIATVSATVAADGTLSYSTSTGGAFNPATGTLAGLSQSAAALSARRQGLDSLANDYAASLNAQHQAGVDAQGNAGAALLDTGVGGAANLTAIALATNQVAAADGSGANGNMLAFAGLRGTGSVEANWAAMVSAHAQATASARAQDSAATSRNNGASEARSHASGIDLDREAADLLRYQQAYQAAAKTIQVARETMQTIFNIF